MQYDNDNDNDNDNNYIKHKDMWWASCDGLVVQSIFTESDSWQQFSLRKSGNSMLHVRRSKMEARDNLENIDNL